MAVFPVTYEIVEETPTTREKVAINAEYEATEGVKTYNEKKIRQMGGDDTLVEIAKCESGLRQFNEDGSILRGKAVPEDTGIFQINLTYHGDTLDSFKLDPEILEHNISYALYLYRKNGTRDWKASESCWRKGLK